MKSILIRMLRILTDPRSEWQVIKNEHAGIRALLKYIAVLAVVPLLVSVFEVLLTGGETGRRFFLLGYPLWYVMIILDVVILGAVISIIVAPVNFRHGFLIAAYTATPLLLVRVMIALPKLGWVAAVAVMYSVYLMYLGVTAFFRIDRTAAAWYSVATFLAAGAVVGILNFFEYMLEAYLARMVVTPAEIPWS